MSRFVYVKFPMELHHSEDLDDFLILVADRLKGRRYFATTTYERLFLEFRFPGHGSAASRFAAFADALLKKFFAPYDIDISLDDQPFYSSES